MYQKLLPRDIESMDKYTGTPFYVYISLSNICNANCVFCDVHQERNKTSKIDIVQTVQELDGLGTKYIHFMGGGEPFTDKRILEYCEFISSLGMKLSATTNGFLLDYDKIMQIKNQAFNHIFFSLDSHAPEMHDKFRGVNGLWEKARENILLLRSNAPSIKIVINHLLHKGNIDSLESMITLKNRLPYDYLNLLLIKDYPAFFFDQRQIERYNKNLKHILEVAEQKNVEFLYDNIDFFHDIHNSIEGYTHGTYNAGNEFNCYFPLLSAYIDCPSAKVFPCDCTVHRDSRFYCCGNLMNSSFKAIWNGRKMSKMRERMKNEHMKCKRNCDIANISFNKLLSSRKYDE